MHNVFRRIVFNLLDEKRNSEKFSDSLYCHFFFLSDNIKPLHQESVIVFLGFKIEV